MKILIAEDDPIIQKLNSRLMAVWGYDFDMVSNGSEAVELVKKNKENSFVDDLYYAFFIPKI